MKMMQRVLCCALAVLLLCPTIASASAKTCRYQDVPNSHWGAEYIEELADGGLIQGYGNNRFGPDDIMNIDQVATVVCRVKGHSIETDNPYWAYEAVRYCRENLYLLPDLGDFTAKNYGVPCTRELAVYMIYKGLGTNDRTKGENWQDFVYENYPWQRDSSNIPDYYNIARKYRESVLEAYYLGLITGVDDKYTFDPQGSFTRAQICTILHRAKITEAAMIPDNSIIATGLSGKELYEEIKSWGDWREWDGGTHLTLTGTNGLNGGIHINYGKEKGLFTVQLKEDAQEQWLGKNTFIDAYGNKVPESYYPNGFCDENGKFVMSSGWNYEARQILKKILMLAYPESYEEAYNVVLSVMKQEVYEIPGLALPSALRWIDGRCFSISLDEASHSMFIDIDPKNETRWYDVEMSRAAIGTTSVYNPYVGGGQIPTAYELHRG